VRGTYVLWHMPFRNSRENFKTVVCG